jgi:hypothetical protein
MTSGVTIYTRNYPSNLMLAHIYLIHVVNYIKFKYKFIDFLDIATGYRVDGRGSFPEKARVFSSPSRPDRLWSQPTSYPMVMYICIYGSTALCWILVAFQFLNPVHQRWPTGGPRLDLLRPPPSHRFRSIGETFNICLILLVQRKM